MSFTRAKVFLAGTTVLLLLANNSCDQKRRKDRLYFDDLSPPVGFEKVKIISDKSLNLPGGGVITVLTVVDPEIDRDDLDRLMKSFYRQVATRGGFAKPGGAERVDLRFYDSEEKAKADGKDWLGQVLRISGEAHPHYENRQRIPLGKWITQALGSQAPFTGALKPTVTTADEKMAATVKVPFVKQDGSGEYVDTINFNLAVREFTHHAMTLFDRVKPLQELTFAGIHQGETVITVTLTRAQYDDLKLRELEAQLAAFQGDLVSHLHDGSLKEREFQRKATSERSRVYRDLLAKLPEEQVTLAKALR